MLVIPKKDYPKDLNALGLKRGDVVQIEIGESTPDFITLDPSTMKLTVMRDASELREPIVKQPKPKADSMANMPLPDLKSMIQKPMPATAAAPAPMPPTNVGSVRG